MSYYQDLRREYMSKGLSRDDLANSPFIQFEKWLGEAIDAKLDMPNALSLATAADFVSIRTVLLKSFDENVFVFFTNYNSTKAKQIAKNPNAAMLFPWLGLDRQVKITGTIQKISKSKSLLYFLSRPIESQIAATCSNQSSIVATRNDILREFNKIKQKFKNKELPLPDNWGGYALVPKKIEFWQGRENRLHDRFVYELTNNSWEINRLNP